MTVLDDVIRRLSSVDLADLEVAGTMDQDGGAYRFRHRLIDVYLRFGPEGRLRCSSIDQYSRLRIEPTDDIALDFGLLEGETYATTSIADLCLAQPGSARSIDAVSMIAWNRADAQAGVVECASFEIQGADCLFLDPRNLFGVRIGGRAERAAWLTEFADHERTRFELIWRRGTDHLAIGPWVAETPRSEEHA